MFAIPPFHAAGSATFVALFTATICTSVVARERILSKQDGWTVATEGGPSCYAYVDYPIGTRLVVEIKHENGNERWSVLIGEHRGRTDLRGRIALRVDGKLVFEGSTSPMRGSSGARLGPVSETAVRAISTGTTLEVASSQGTTRYALTGAATAVKQVYTCATGGDQVAASNDIPANAAANMFSVKDDVTTGYANMRSGPGLGWPIIAKIPAGTDGLKRVGPCRDRDDAPGPQFCPSTGKARRALCRSRTWTMTINRQPLHRQSQRWQRHRHHSRNRRHHQRPPTPAAAQASSCRHKGIS